MLKKTNSLTGSTEDFIKNNILNKFPNQLKHQDKRSITLLNRINILTTLLISSELEFYKVHCPCCNSSQHIDCYFSFVNQEDKEIINGRIKCLNCGTSINVSNIKTIKDLKKDVRGWIKDD